MKGFLFVMTIFLGAILPWADAFVPVVRQDLSVVQRGSWSPTHTTTTTTTTTAATAPLKATALAMKKKPEPSSEKQRITNPVELIILYMTPWRNPNSIFVYLFGLLYLLGTISEARSAAGQ